MESKFTKRITEELRRCNAVVCVIHQSTFSTPGTPDRYVCHAWWHGMLEFKGEKTMLKPHQRRMIKQLNMRRRNSALVVRAPGTLEDEQGRVKGHFTTGWDLLRLLCEM